MTIDYGRGQTNIDHATGIRYGVIPMHEVTQAWCDSSEPWYGEHEDDDFAEPMCHYVDDGEYHASQGADDCDIFISKSPYYTLCGFCSPCAPGAGYLLTRSDDCKAYCFGHDWFDDRKAPYEVYRVSDDSLVLPE